MQPFASRKPRLNTLAPQTPKQGDQVPLWVLDLLLGTAVALVIAIVITADQGGSQDPDAIAYLFACAFGALMLVRRRFPVAVLVTTMFALFAYYALGYPAIGLAVPVAAALYSGAELGHLTAAVVVSLILIVVSTYFRILEGQAIPYLLGYELISTVTLMAAAIALGDSTRARRALRVEQEQSARLIEQAHERRAAQRIQAERMRMARDLHDLLGHTISVISLHADVAKEAIGHDDDQAKQALHHIRAATSATMRELRTTVKLLRNPAHEPAERAVTTLASLPALVESAKASGLEVDIYIEGEPATLPAAVTTAAYRIIQESLTNVMRHANATRITLAMVIDAKEVRLQVADNGTTPVGPITPGSGIAGMADRARVLGGTLTAHVQPTGGFQVDVTLPLQEEK